MFADRPVASGVNARISECELDPLLLVQCSYARGLSDRYLNECEPVHSMLLYEPKDGGE